MHYFAHFMRLLRGEGGRGTPQPTFDRVAGPIAIALVVGLAVAVALGPDLPGPVMEAAWQRIAAAAVAAGVVALLLIALWSRRHRRRPAPRPGATARRR